MPTSHEGYERFVDVVGLADGKPEEFVERILDQVAICGWTPGDDAEAHLWWAAEIHDAMRRFAAGGVYVNALGDEPSDRVRAAYGDNWPRLTELKRRYDPENVFRLNANIAPA
jgi:FAD/FMN-containing dehydrogenase